MAPMAVGHAERKRAVKTRFLLVEEGSGWSCVDASLPFGLLSVYTVGKENAT